MSDPCADDVERRRIGKRVEFHDLLDSTNSRALALGCSPVERRFLEERRALVSSRRSSTPGGSRSG